MTGARGLEDELAEGGDPYGAQGESAGAELGGDGGVAGWLAGVAAGEEPLAGTGAVGGQLQEQAGEGRGTGAGGWPRWMRIWPLSSRVMRRRTRVRGWAHRSMRQAAALIRAGGWSSLM
jgi:hypothetical protein